MAGDGLAVGGDGSTLMVVNEGAGNAAAGCDLMIGGGGDDVIAGDAIIAGGSGTVTVEHHYLLGLPAVGRDTIFGGNGDDTLIGGSGADVFDFNGDAAGGSDAIVDFNVGEGDVIDLSDLLEGVMDGTDAAEIDAYIDFSVNVPGTTMHIDTNGAAPGGETVTILLEGYFNIDSDQNVIQDLLDGNNLAA